MPALADAGIEGITYDPEKQEGKEPARHKGKVGTAIERKAKRGPVGGNGSVPASRARVPARDGRNLSGGLGRGLVGTQTGRCLVGGRTGTAARAA